MSEVYWLGGAEPAAWAAQTARLGIRPTWIDEAHWFGLPPQPAWMAAPPSFEWPEAPDGLQIRLLQDCARLLLSGARSLALLASPDAFCLLASPRAVGRLNLIPAARLGSFGALPSASSLQALARASELPLPEDPLLPAASWLALFPPPPPAVQGLQPAAQGVLDLPPALLQRCEDLRGETHDPAELLWQLLEGGEINQMEFSRRQELDGQSIDFFCPQAGLVVLIDHRADLEDAHRMHVFAQHGLRVLRFWNSQVIEETPEVLQTIWNAVSGTPAPAPQQAEPAPQSIQAAPRILPAPPGIAGLNAVYRELKTGWRGLLVENLPGRPLAFITVEGL